MQKDSFLSPSLIKFFWSILLSIVTFFDVLTIGSDYTRIIYEWIFIKAPSTLTYILTGGASFSLFSSGWGSLWTLVALLVYLICILIWDYILVCLIYWLIKKIKNK